MARLFNEKIFDGILRGTTLYITDASLNEKLARGNTLVIHVKVLQSSGTSPTLTATVQHSGNNVDFEDNKVVASATDIANPPVNVIDATTAALAGYARVELVLGGSDNEATVQVFATSRDD